MDPVSPCSGGRHEWTGLPCAPGRAAGRVWRWPGFAETQQRALTQQPSSVRLGAALAWVEAELGRLRMRLAGTDPDELAYLDIQRFLLRDPHLGGVAQDLAGRGLAAEDAVVQAVLHAKAILHRTGDAGLRARMIDCEQVGQRLLSALQFARAKPASAALRSPRHGVVLVAPELPVDVLLDLLGPAGPVAARPLRALLLERGGPLSHTAILARQRGIPVVGGLAGLSAESRDGDGVLVSGDAGRVLLRPDRAALRIFSSWPDRGPCCPGRPTSLAPPKLRVLANLDLPEDGGRAYEVGADGIGMLRTDSLLCSDEAPSVGAQARRYAELLRSWPGTTVAIRLFDAPGAGSGGALGPRGVRWLGLAPGRSDDQLLALCQAALQVPSTRLVVLAPMLSHPDELVTLSQRLLRHWRGLSPSSTQKPPGLGAMVETPAAALCIDGLLDLAELVAIGSNDLLQFLVGASREDPRLAPLLDPDHPALWRLLAQVAEACRQRCRPAIVCGTLAAEPRTARRLLRLGYTQLSVGLAEVRRVRRLWAGAGPSGVDITRSGS